MRNGSTTLIVNDGLHGVAEPAADDDDEFFAQPRAGAAEVEADAAAFRNHVRKQRH